LAVGSQQSAVSGQRSTVNSLEFGIWNSYKLHPFFSFIFKNANFVAWLKLNKPVFKDFLQGRVESPTGGESPRIRQLADRSGATPEPTVKVWMEEEFLTDKPF
jgi:hypothetical protein